MYETIEKQKITWCIDVFRVHFEEGTFKSVIALLMITYCMEIRFKSRPVSNMKLSHYHISRPKSLHWLWIKKMKGEVTVALEGFEMRQATCNRTRVATKPAGSRVIRSSFPQAYSSFSGSSKPWPILAGQGAKSVELFIFKAEYFKKECHLKRSFSVEKWKRKQTNRTIASLRHRAAEDQNDSL